MKLLFRELECELSNVPGILVWFLAHFWLSSQTIQRIPCTMRTRSAAPSCEQPAVGCDSPCVLCREIGGHVTVCKALRLEASGQPLSVKFQQWELFCKSSPSLSNLGLTFEIPEAEVPSVMCSSCLTLLSGIDRLDVEMEEKFQALAKLNQRNMLALDCVESTMVTVKEEHVGEEVLEKKAPPQILVPKRDTGDDVSDDLDDGVGQEGEGFSESDVSDEDDEEDVDFPEPSVKLTSVSQKRPGRPRKRTHSGEESSSPIQKRRVGPKQNKTKRKSEEVSCDHCDMKFMTLKTLKMHEMEVHGIAKPFSCSHCDKTFSRDSALSRHIREMHQNRPRAKVKCPHCPKIFTRWNVVRKHANRVHGEPPSVACDKCGKLFVTTAERRLHVAHCDGSGNVPAALEEEHAVCPICGEVKKGANAQYRLTVHIDGVHKKIKKHKCQLCPAAFEHSRSLLRHESLVHHVRPERYQFPCDVCGKIMQTKRDLELHKFSKHQILERDVEVFTCSHCNKQFLKKQAYELHVRVHEGVKPHACPECEYRASSFGALKNHLKTGHRRNIRRVFAEGCKDETIYTIVDVGDEDDGNGDEVMNGQSEESAN